MNKLYFLWLSIIEPLSDNLMVWMVLFPMFIIIELPLSLLVITGVIRWAFTQRQAQTQSSYYPNISVIVTCYSEGHAIRSTIDTLIEQVYPANIEILLVVDGASQNIETYQAAKIGAKTYQNHPLRQVKVIPKWQRGGRVSTLNAGLHDAKYELVINVDGDTSFDNNMAYHIANQFNQPHTLACGGGLRVRNWKDNLLTRMQAVEYMLSMQTGKTGMGNWGVLNNISGAFGAFRKETLKKIGGWDTHTAEDLDLTMRFKQYKTRYPNIKLAFTPLAIGHTDVPNTLKGLIDQRLRWDGDLLFLFLRKHKKGLTPKLLGWGNFIFTLTYGILQNILLPLMVALYTAYMLYAYPLDFVVAILGFIFSTYFVIVLFFFGLYLCAISERPKQDIQFTIWLPLYPAYQFVMRFITAFATLNELFRRSHEESSMAPWWVLKKGKRF
ncbi:glycosyltransferase [Vibrio sp. CK2-1]|uniref:glycosyltransferase family 2 protein n=1 Tax=Vibrio sp. CK2-1 TaxID=2912249 RepID=UPI001F32A923|nr:glycosyltransferase [Vibrio sp. CK2-1]MCF7352597.1 glycosyltransferase [Vibrio sp. CK2-1]